MELGGFEPATNAIPERVSAIPCEIGVNWSKLVADKMRTRVQSRWELGGPGWPQNMWNTRQSDSGPRRLTRSGLLCRGHPIAAPGPPTLGHAPGRLPTSDMTQKLAPYRRPNLRKVSQIG